MLVRSAQSPRRPLRPAARRCLAAAAACIALVPAGPARAADLVEARRLYQTGQYAECAAAAAEQIERGNYVEQWRRLKIEAELAQGSYGAALATAEEALSIYPASVSLRTLAYAAYLYNGQTARAQVELDMIERLVLSNARHYSTPESRIALGRFFLRRGADARQVLEVFYDPCIDNWPDYIDGHLAAAELALDKYDNALAAETLAKAPPEAKDDPEYHYLLARALLRDDPQAANETMAAALAINPRHARTLLLQADGLIDSEQYDAADEALNAVLAVNPGEPLAWAYKAVLAHLRGDVDAERASRDRALSTWIDNPEIDHLIGRKLSDKYRFAEGAEHQRRALEMDATFAPARMQLAQDLLRLGEDGEGWRLAAEAFDADGYNVVAHNLVTLHDSVKTYRVLANDAFRVRMEAREASVYGQRVLTLLDRARATLCDKYDVTLDRPISVEIFPEQKDFAVRTFGLPGADGFLGVCFGNVITANSPAALGDVRANWESVLWHEFCHVVTLRKSRNTMPRWLSEGISVYEERQADPTWGQSMSPQYRQLILDGKMPPVSRLSGSFLAPESAEALQFAYFQSSLVVEYIVDKYGLNALTQVLDDLGSGMQIEESLVRNVAPLRRLDTEFEAFARHRAEQLAPELTWEEFDLPSRATADEVAEWLAEHPENFQGLLRLSQSLQREGQWRESLEPAELLCKLFPDYVGPGHAYAVLARAHRELGDAAAERKVLEEWARRSPDAIDAYERLVALAEEAGDWEAVALNARRIIAVNPLMPAPHRWLARSAEELGRPDDAIAAHRALLEFDTTDPVAAHYRLAVLLAERGDGDDARRHALMALEEAPRFRDAHRLLLTLVDEPAAETPAEAPPSTAPSQTP